MLLKLSIGVRYEQTNRNEEQITTFCAVAVTVLLITQTRVEGDACFPKRTVLDLHISCFVDEDAELDSNSTRWKQTVHQNVKVNNARLDYQRNP